MSAEMSTSQKTAPSSPNKVTIQPTTYHGWSGSYVISNGLVEAVVVPTIGRIMQFRIVGDDTGVFWENRALDGKVAEKPESEWTNLGGDKTWPAPQDAWLKVTGRPWPPPLAFDALPLTATVQGSDLVLTSPVDPNYGIKTIRRITLDPSSAKMTVKTSFEKVSGEPVNAGVWIITQLRDPQRVFALLPEHPKKAPGYYRMVGDAMKDFEHQGRLISFRRDPASNLKIGAEGNSLLWIGEKYVLHIKHDSPAGANSVYTNMDPLQYVELETEGPVAELKVGESIELTNTYELSRRTTQDVTGEARKVFGLNHN